MNPTLSDVHVNVPLSNLSVAYIQNQSAFVSGDIFPVVPVQKKSDVYYRYSRGDMNRDEMAERAPATEAAGGGYRIDNSPTYNCKVYALRKDIDDQIRANADSVLSLDSEATTWLTLKALIKRERLWQSTFFDTGIWTSEKAGQGSADSTHVKYWDDPASTPIEDIRSMKRDIHLAGGGFMPNTITFGPRVWDKIVDHPDFVDRIKYGQTANPSMSPAMVSRAVVAQLLEVERVLVMEGIVNTMAETANMDDESNAYIAGKHCLLTYSPPNPGLMTPSAGYTFAWTGYFGAQAAGNRIKSYRWEPTESERIEIQMAFVHKLISADLGGIFYNVIS